MTRASLPRRRFHLRCVALGMAIASLGISGHGQAASGTWITASGTSDWSVAGNWAGGTIADGIDATANFSSLNITTNTGVVLDSSRTVGGLTFGDQTAGSSWTLSNSGGSVLTLAVTSGAPTVTLGPNMSTSRQATINATLAGTQGLQLSGTGTLVLSASNTYSGTTTVAANTSLRLSDNHALGDPSGAINVLSQSELVLNNNVTVSGRTVSIRGSGVDAQGALKASGTAEWAGNVVLEGSAASAIDRVGTLDANSQLTISGVISSGTATNLAISGLGTTILTAVNTYTGSTTIYRGTLKIDGGNNRLPTGTALDLGGTSNDATFDLNAHDQAVATITQGATTGTLSTGAATITNSGLAASTLTIGKSSGSANYQGNITGQLALVKTGNNSQTLSGANTYTGNTSVNAGTLILADNSSTTFVIQGNGVNNQINGSGVLNLNGDFVFDLSGASTAVGASWNIVNVATLTETFGATFAVAGFTELNNVWTSGNYQFSEATGVLRVVPEPSSCLLAGLGLAAVTQLLRRRKA